MMNTRLLIRPISDIKILDTIYSSGYVGLLVSLYDRQLMLVGDTISLDFDNQSVNPQYNVDTIITGIDSTNNVVITDIPWGVSTTNETGWIRNLVRCGSEDIGSTILDPGQYNCGGSTERYWTVVAANQINALIEASGPPPGEYKITGYYVATQGDNLLWYYNGTSWSSSTPANGTDWFDLETCTFYQYNSAYFPSAWAIPEIKPFEASGTEACWGGTGSGDVIVVTQLESFNCDADNVTVEIGYRIDSGRLNVWIEGATPGEGTGLLIDSGGSTSVIAPIGPDSFITFGGSGLNGCITSLSIRCSDCESLRFKAVELDLRENLQFPLSYQIADIREPQNRKSDFSKTITLPGTDHNNKVFTELFEIGVDSVYDVNRKKDVFVLQDGLEILRGVIKLDRINRDDNFNVVSYDISIQGKLADIFASLKNGDGKEMQLSDIDLSEFNHDWNRENIINSWVGQIQRNGATYSNFSGATYSVTDTYFGTAARTMFSLGSTHSIQVGDNVLFIADDPSIFPSSSGNHTVIEVGATSVTVNLPFQSTAINSGTLQVMEMDGVGYVYPTINLSKAPGEIGSWITSDYRPAVYAKTYVDKIFQKIGYTYESDFFESSFFKRLVIPGSIADPRSATGSTGSYGISDYMSRTTDLLFPTYDYSTSAAQEYGLEFEITGGTFSGSTGIACDGIFAPTAAASAVSLGFSPVFLGDASPFQVTQSGLFNGVAFVTFAIDVSNVYNSGTSTNPRLRRMRVNPDIVYYPGQVYSDPTIFWDNDSDDSIPVAFGATTTIGMITVPLNLNNVQVFSGNNICLSVGMVVQLWNQYGFQSYSPAASNNFAVVDESGTDTYVDCDINLRVTSALFGRVSASGIVDLNKTIPKDFTARDFLIGLINMFNLYIEPDKANERNLIIEPFNTYYDRDDVLDWTDKVDISQNAQIEPTSPTLPKTYALSYTEDRDRFNAEYKTSWDSNYGEQEVTRDTDFNTNTSTIKTTFSPTPLVDVDQDGTVIPTILKPGSFNRVESYRPRILYFQGWRPRFTFLLDGISTSDILGTDGYGYAGHFDNPLDASIDLNYGFCQEYFYGPNFNITENTLYNTYFRNYIEELTDKDTRLVSFKTKLKSSDLANLSFRRFYYIDNILYRLQKISDYDPLSKDPCEVTLIKAKTLPPSDITPSGLIRPPRPFRPTAIPSPSTNPGVVVTGTIATNPNTVVGPNTSSVVSVGADNVFGPDVSDALVVGDRNRIGASANGVKVFGYENVVPDGLKDIVIFGSGVTASTDETIYFNAPIVFGPSSGGTFTGTGPQGPTGPTGLDGATGPTGPTGIAGVTAEALITGGTYVLGTGATGIIILTYSPSFFSSTVGDYTKCVMLVGQGNDVGATSALISLIGSGNNSGDYSSGNFAAGSNNDFSYWTTGNAIIGWNNTISATASINCIVGEGNSISAGGIENVIVGYWNTAGVGSTASYNLHFGASNIGIGDDCVLVGIGNVNPLTSSASVAFGIDNICAIEGVAIGIGASGIAQEVAAGGTWNFQGNVNIEGDILGNLLIGTINSSPIGSSANVIIGDDNQGGAHINFICGTANNIDVDSSNCTVIGNSNQVINNANRVTLIGTNLSGDTDDTIILGGTTIAHQFVIGDDETSNSVVNRSVSGVLRFDRASGPTTTASNLVTGAGDGVTGPQLTVSIVSEGASALTFTIDWTQAFSSNAYCLTMSPSYVSGGLTGGCSLDIVKNGGTQVTVQIDRTINGWTSGIIDVNFSAMAYV